MRGQYRVPRGESMELALHIVYARGADRILGREYPGVPKAQINEDRGSHSLAELHCRIIKGPERVQHGGCL